VKTFQNRRGPKERQWAKRFMYTVVPLGGLFALLLGFLFGFYLFLIVLGISLLPTGVMAWLDNAKVNKRDQELAPFLRSLGNVTASMGTTVGASMEKIDRRALGTMEPTIRRLQIRLRKQISPEKSWNAFRDEAGSELINRASRMFVDGVGLGGPPEQVGAIAAEFSMDAALMRSRRLVSAAPFAFLVIPLHFAMTGLMVFVLEIMKAFNSRITEAATTLEAQSEGSGLALLPSLPVFQSHDMGMLSLLTMVALVPMTISNALTPKFALGGHSMLTALFGGITLIMTGFNLFIIPPIAAQVLLPPA
jgi:flagellar protein FlaJ